MCQGCVYSQQDLMFVAMETGQDNLETDFHDCLGQCLGWVVVGTGMEETEMLW